MYNWRCTCVNERIDNRPQIVIGDRGSGKTVRLIKQASETNGIIVCPNRHMADYVFRMAIDLGYSINRPITYERMFAQLNGRRNIDCYIDEYGLILESVLQRVIDGFCHDCVKTIIIDRESIKRLNDILRGLKVRSINGKKLRLKIEICEED